MVREVAVEGRSVRKDSDQSPPPPHLEAVKLQGWFLSKTRRQKDQNLIESVLSLKQGILCPNKGNCNGQQSNKNLILREEAKGSSWRSFTYCFADIERILSSNLILLK